MQRIITLSLFLSVFSGCAFAHPTTKSHNPHYEYEEYHIVYPSYYVVYEYYDHYWHTHSNDYHSHFYKYKGHTHHKKKYKKYKKKYKKKYFRSNPNSTSISRRSIKSIRNTKRKNTPTITKIS